MTEAKLANDALQSSPLRLPLHKQTGTSHYQCYGFSGREAYVVLRGMNSSSLYFTKLSVINLLVGMADSLDSRPLNHQRDRARCELHYL